MDCDRDTFVMEITVGSDMVIVGVGIHHQDWIKTFILNKRINLRSLVAGIYNNSFLGIFACKDVAVCLEHSDWNTINFHIIHPL